MPDISQMDDEREPLTDDEIEKLAHPTSGVRRYDRRAVAQSRREQRKRERELRKIDRTCCEIAESLKGKDDLPSKRLLYDIVKDQRDRIEGKPFIATNPDGRKKGRATVQDQRLRIAIQSLIMPHAAPEVPKQLESAEPAEQLPETVQVEAPEPPTGSS